MILRNPIIAKPARLGVRLPKAVLTESAAGDDGSLQATGQSMALGDLLIGTTALELGYAVVTHNVRHFQMIPNLVVKQLGRKGVHPSPIALERSGPTQGRLSLTYEPQSLKVQLLETRCPSLLELAWVPTRSSRPLARVEWARCIKRATPGWIVP
jgi:hypothetical protein